MVQAQKLLSSFGLVLIFRLAQKGGRGINGSSYKGGYVRLRFGCSPARFDENFKGDQKRFPGKRDRAPTKRIRPRETENLSTSLTLWVAEGGG